MADGMKLDEWPMVRSSTNGEWQEDRPKDVWNEDGRMADGMSIDGMADDMNIEGMAVRRSTVWLYEHQRY